MSGFVDAEEAPSEIRSVMDAVKTSAYRSASGNGFSRWLFLHVLDITYTIVENWHGQLRLSCGTEMNFSAMAVLSLSQVTHDTRIIDSAVESLRKMHFDRVDYLGLQANAIFHRCSHFLKTIMPPTSRTEPEIKRLLTIMQLLQSIVPRLFRTLMEWRDGGMIKAAGFEKLDAAVGRYAKEELPHYFDVLLPLVDSIFEMKSLPTIFEAGQFVSNQGLRRFWPFASKCTHFMNLRPENRQFVFAKSWMLLHLADLAHIVTTKTVSDGQELDSGETLFVRNLAFVEGDQGVRMWNTILGYIRKFKPKEFANFRYLMLLKTIEAHDPSDPQIVKAAINAILNSFTASFLDGFAQLLYKQLDALVIYTMRVLLKRREELNAGSLLWEHVESVQVPEMPAPTAYSSSAKSRKEKKQRQDRDLLFIDLRTLLNVQSNLSKEKTLFKAVEAITGQEERKGRLAAEKEQIRRDKEKAAMDVLKSFIIENELGTSEQRNKLENLVTLEIICNFLRSRATASPAPAASVPPAPSLSPQWPPLLSEYAKILQYLAFFQPAQFFALVAASPMFQNKEEEIDVVGD
ncbi:unnamed protein product [Caenorhabditis sp. 36 PRJEB53466]|nr:unnamed protein product [Caenorhabditis sp. 36 PRJEB53466]